MDFLGPTSQSAPFEQDRAQKLDASQFKSSERIFITHILVTDVIACLHRLPADVYIDININGTITRTSNQLISTDAKDVVEWHQQVFLPLEKSIATSLKVYASLGIGPQIPGRDELLCEFKATVGELLDRNGELQFPRNGEDSLSCPSLRVTVERRVWDVDHNASGIPVREQSTITASEVRSYGMFQKLSALFSRPKPPNSDSLDANTGPRIFALIVAIDKYKSEKHENLIGCKHDGESFKKYLTGVLGVPLSQIMSLEDENATRDTILQQFKNHFIDNNNIEKGDAMVFFYAGHGTQEDSPPDWPSEYNKMEALCPHDANTIGHDGEEIYAIPDRTISGLIRTLARSKGDNIVFILDCCHSGGATRAAEIPSLRVRSTSAASRPPPLDLDREIWEITLETSSRGAGRAIKGSPRALESHVLLAACRPNEVASGDANGGLFTRALLKALKNCALHETTYTRLFERLHVKNHAQYPQHPQCLGGYRDRLLFTVTAVRNGETVYKVIQREQKLFVSAGSIHGIIVGTEFTVRSGPQSVALKAVEVDAFESLLEHFPHWTFDLNNVRQGAVVSNWNHPRLRVYSAVHRPCAHYTIVTADEEADIAIRQNGPEWEFERFDPLSLTYSTRRIIVEAEARMMLEAPVLIANFNSYLYRSDRSGGSFGGEIKVRLNRIGKDGNLACPVGEDLLDVPSVWFEELEIKQAMITDLDSEYCVTIENFSDVDLFPYLFYFDPTDYAVQAWYMPPSPNMVPPLQRSKGDGKPSVFAYGYGGFGTDPIEFYLPPGQMIDSGFLKIFLTNAFVDMNSVAQYAITKMRLTDPKIVTPTGIWECRTYVMTCKAS